MKAAARLLVDRLRGAVSEWLKEIEVLIISVGTTGKVEANDAAIKTNQLFS